MTIPNQLLFYRVGLLTDDLTVKRLFWLRTANHFLAKGARKTRRERNNAKAFSAPKCSLNCHSRFPQKN